MEEYMAVMIPTKHGGVSTGKPGTISIRKRSQIEEIEEELAKKKSAEPAESVEEKTQAEELEESEATKTEEVKEEPVKEKKPKKEKATTEKNRKQ